MKCEYCRSKDETIRVLHAAIRELQAEIAEKNALLERVLKWTGKGAA